METKRRIETINESASDVVVAQLKERVIGQDEAIEAIGGAFEKARLRDERRPVANLMFLGPTGTGKTEVAESLADILAVDKLHPNIIRIDCAQYANGYEVSNLVGAPPGYVGREQAPALDKAVIEQPGSVVLFDEIEKGHPKLWNYLLQIMEGRGVKLLGNGETVSFGNSTVIMTSNVGAKELEDIATERRIGFTTPDLTKPQKMESVAMNALKRQFAPEFINRLDAMVTFKSLDDEQLGQVLDTHVTRSNLRYERKANVNLRLGASLRDEIVATADLRREFNARPVLRNYERMVETELSRLVNGGQVGGSVVHAELEDGHAVFYEGDPMPTFEDLLALEAGNPLQDDYEPPCETDESA